uniref:Uncharacterized protein n=1 Tax=Lepeophtheirus salmonis TaxID=72036 RepID=A0A0K2V9C8_LEPSM
MLNKDGKVTFPCLQPLEISNSPCRPGALYCWSCFIRNS